MSGLGVPVGLLAMFVGGGGVVLGLVMLADGMVVRRLVMMMSRGMVVSGGIMVVFGGGVLLLFGHNRSPDWRLDGPRSMLEIGMLEPVFFAYTSFVPSSFSRKRGTELTASNLKKGPRVLVIARPVCHHTDRDLCGQQSSLLWWPSRRPSSQGEAPVAKPRAGGPATICDNKTTRLIVVVDALRLLKYDPGFL